MLGRERIELKTPEQVRRMREAGLVVADVHAALREAVRPGVTTGELDAVSAGAIARAGARSNFLGYQGYPATVCVSVNDEVVHGIPGPRVLEDGDLVFTVDGEAEYEALSSDELMFDANISILDAIGGDAVPSDRSLNVFAKSAGGVDTWYGWISVAEGLGDRTGGVCFYATVLTGVDDTCADEGDSTLTLVGADTVELVEDADTCDGCSDVTVNGESVDPYCD